MFQLVRYSGGAVFPEVLSDSFRAVNSVPLESSNLISGLKAWE